jgi:hypothetical protein
MLERRDEEEENVTITSLFELAGQKHAAAASSWREYITTTEWRREHCLEPRLVLLSHSKLEILYLESY